MNKLFTATIAALIAVVFASQAQAQISPVRLKVNKVSKKDRKTNSKSVEGDYRSQDIAETVFYTIEVTNASTAPVNDIQIKWAVLIKGASSYSSSSSASGLKVVEGDRTCSLELGQKFSFDTDPIQLSNTQVDSSYSYGTSRYKYGAEVAGYVVEVSVGGRVVASEILPIDTKKKIQALKAPAKGNPKEGPPVHKF